MTGILDELFVDIDRDTFLSEVWPETPHVTHGSLERISWLDAVPELHDAATFLEHLAARNVGVLVSVGPDKDEHTAFEMSARDAARFHERGAMFSCGGADRHNAALADVLDRMRTELGLPRWANPRNNVYGSKPGQGAVWHWDGGANVVVQLSGVKRWHLAENRYLPRPHDRYAVTMPELPARLRPYAVDPPPAGGPDRWTSVDLVPGSVLFLPRGHWHSTECIAGGLSLNFTFGQPDLAQVVGRHLVHELRHDVRWRALARGAVDDPVVGTGEAKAELTALIGDLAERIAALDPDEVVAMLRSG